MEEKRTGQNNILIDSESDAKEEARPLSDAHCSKVMLKATKGKNRDKVIMHYKCNYCSKSFLINIRIIPLLHYCSLKMIGNVLASWLKYLNH